MFGQVRPPDADKVCRPIWVVRNEARPRFARGSVAEVVRDSRGMEHPSCRRRSWHAVHDAVKLDLVDEILRWLAAASGAILVHVVMFNSVG